MTAQTAKFIKFHDFARRSVAYSVFIDGDKAGETYRTGRNAWAIEDWATGETYTAGTRTEAVRALVQAHADAAFAAKVKAEVEREWAKIEAGREHSRSFLTTAENAMLAAEENADDSARELGFERHSDQWYSYVLSGYTSNLDCADWGYEYPEQRANIYVRNIDEDIENGLIKAL
jgi:hypothetical protein